MRTKTRSCRCDGRSPPSRTSWDDSRPPVPEDQHAKMKMDDMKRNYERTKALINDDKTKLSQDLDKVGAYCSDDIRIECIIMLFSLFHSGLLYTICYTALQECPWL